MIRTRIIDHTNMEVSMTLQTFFIITRINSDWMNTPSPLPIGEQINSW